MSLSFKFQAKMALTLSSVSSGQAVLRLRDAQRGQYLSATQLEEVEFGRASTRSLFAGAATATALMAGLRGGVRRRLQTGPLTRGAEGAGQDEVPQVSGTPKLSDNSRVSLAASRLGAAESTLRRWGYISEVVYTWLGIISLAIAAFAASAHGGLGAYRTPSVGLGLSSVGLSVLCALVGWFQARTCRILGRRCGLAASSLEQGGPEPPIPSMAEIESNLRARQRTAWIGALFAVVGLQTMVGLLVTKVLMNPVGIGVAASTGSGVSLDVFTLLAVSNSALSHIVGGGSAVLQQAALPLRSSSSDDPLGGWARY